MDDYSVRSFERDQRRMSRRVFAALMVLAAIALGVFYFLVPLSGSDTSTPIPSSPTSNAQVQKLQQQAHTCGAEKSSWDFLGALSDHCFGF